MIIREAFKFRLKPTPDVEQKFIDFSGCCRFLWNKVRRLNLDRLEGKHLIMRFAESCKFLTFLKQTDECAFLKECHSQVLQQELKDLDRAFKDAFDKNQANKKLPVAHKRYIHDGFRYTQRFKIENRRIYLPKIGWVGFFKSQEIVGTPKNVSITRKGNHWYCSIQVEYSIPDPVHPCSDIIGLDAGVKHFAALSDGEIIEGINSFKKLEEKLAKLQRTLSRRVKFSANWKKLKRKISALHEKIADIRRDFLHKLSTALSKNHAMVAVEALKIKNMSKSAHGSVDNPGVNVKAKSGLNKAILDQGWGELYRQLEYKLSWLGGRLLRVNARNSSNECSACQYVDKANRVDRDSFKCQRCGHEDHADINAAKVIKRRGIAGLACESNPVVGRKQEPLGKSDLVPA